MYNCLCLIDRDNTRGYITVTVFSSSINHNNVITHSNNIDFSPRFFLVIPKNATADVQSPR